MLFRSLLIGLLAVAFAAGSLVGVTEAADPVGTPPSPAPAATAGLPPGNTVVARINGTDLHLSDVEAAQQSLPPQAQKMPLAQIYPMLLDRMIDGMLITEAGRKEHLDQSPEVQRRLKQLEDRLIQQVYLEQMLKGAETEDKLKVQYQKFLKQQAAKEEVHARHILL